MAGYGVRLRVAPGTKVPTFLLAASELEVAKGEVSICVKLARARARYTKDGGVMVEVEGMTYQRAFPPKSVYEIQTLAHQTLAYAPDFCRNCRRRFASEVDPKKHKGMNRRCRCGSTWKRK